MEDAVIAGAGPIGLACAVSAKRRGLDALLLDGGVLVNSITRYPIGMTFFTTPESSPLAFGGIWGDWVGDVCVEGSRVAESAWLDGICVAEDCCDEL